MRNRSLAVLIITIWFLLRGGVSLLEILLLLSRVSGHMYFFPVIVESLVWIALGVGLLGQSKIAMFLGIGWACLQEVWGTYGFVVTSSWRSTPRLGAYLVGTAINAAIVIVLLRYQKRFSSTVTA
jgi:hypothetical protein